MTYKVVFSPEAEEQLLNLYHYLAGVASPVIAFNYIHSIIDYCESFCTFPLRGNTRDDIRPSLRITNYRRQTVIAFSVEPEQVSIIGVFYGGQNYSAKLQE